MRSRHQNPMIDYNFYLIKSLLNMRLIKIGCGIIFCGYLSTVVVADPLQNEQSCKKQGGIWGKFGLMEIHQCNLPANDANKICIDSSQCEGVCFVDAPTAKGAHTKGRCYARTITLGTCLNLVKNGIAQGQVCED